MDKVENIQALVKMLTQCTNSKNELKVMTAYRVKIQTITPACFAEIIKQLDEKKTEFYTYKPKIERNFKLIFKNMHPSFDLTEISDALFGLGHVVKNI